ncbi:hypothetical protein [Actinomycetospora flava]|uniref:Uncharacterized protein n=1 Tax=Actinomycetospora flava TaxID=3129232 RepID=A0ABU8MGP3_9PSEU
MLDGSVLDEWFDAHGQGDAENTDLLAAMQRLDAESDALVTGRRTFEDIRLLALGTRGHHRAAMSRASLTDPHRS